MGNLSKWVNGVYAVENASVKAMWEPSFLMVSRIISLVYGLSVYRLLCVYKVTHPGFLLSSAARVEKNTSRLHNRNIQWSTWSSENDIYDDGS